MNHCLRALLWDWGGRSEAYDMEPLSHLVVRDSLPRLMSIMTREAGENHYGPKRTHGHKDPTFWFKGPRQGNSRNHGVWDPHVHTVQYIPYTICDIYFIPYVWTFGPLHARGLHGPFEPLFGLRRPARSEAWSGFGASSRFSNHRRIGPKSPNIWHGVNMVYSIWYILYGI